MSASATFSGCSSVGECPHRSIHTIRAPGIPAVILGLPAPYPADAAQWVTDELITTSA